MALRRRLLPLDVRRHLRAACRENLLALRAWLEARIGQQEEQAPPTQGRRPTRRRRERR